MKIKKSKLKRKKNVNNSKKKRLNRNKNRKKSLYLKGGDPENNNNNNEFHDSQENDKGICENTLKGEWDKDEEICFYDATEQFDFFNNKKEVDEVEIKRINDEIEKYSNEIQDPEKAINQEKEVQDPEKAIQAIKKKIKDKIKERIKDVFIFALNDDKIIGIKKEFIKKNELKTLTDVLQYIYGNNDRESTTNKPTKEESNVIIPTDDKNYVNIMKYLIGYAKILDTKLKEDKVAVLEEEKNQQTAGGFTIPKVTKGTKLTAAIGYTLSVALGPITVIGIGVVAAYQYSKYKNYGRHPIIRTCKDTHKLFNDIQNIETICRQKVESEEGLSDEEREKYLENIKEIMIKISLNKNTLQESLTKFKTTKESSDSNSTKESSDSNPATALIDTLKFNYKCKSSDKSSGGGDGETGNLTRLVKEVVPAINEILEAYKVGIQDYRKIDCSRFKEVSFI